MVNPLFKVLKIDKVYSNFDKKVQTIGWLNGCRWLIKNLKVNIESKVSVPKQGAVVITSNHPTGLDPYLLTAVLKREDSYYWGDI